MTPHLPPSQLPSREGHTFYQNVKLYSKSMYWERDWVGKPDKDSLEFNSVKEIEV